MNPENKDQADSKLPGKPLRIGFALNTMDRVHLTQQILPGLDGGGFDLIWCDGSRTPEGRAFASASHFSTTKLKGIHYDVTGGPDAAIQYSLKQLLALGYDYVGLIENDIVLSPGWLPALMAAWESAQADGFKVGAVTARSIASRVLAHAPSYVIKWNMGAGMVLFSREAAQAVLEGYNIAKAAEIRGFYRSKVGVDLSAVWELFMGMPDRDLGADWRYAASMLQAGMVAVGTLPNLAKNIDLDLEKALRSKYVKSTSDIPAHSIPVKQLLSILKGPPASPPEEKSPVANVTDAEKKCWCGGSLTTSVNPLYGKCVKCATLVLKRAPTAEDLKKYYSLQGYWYEHQQRDCGFPDIEKRATADAADRIPVWHRLLTQAKSDVGNLLEIGCAHGGFLNYCRERGVQTVVGVEVDEDTCKFAREHFDLPHVCAGLFPAARLPINQFGAVTGFDVLEHFLDPVAALKSVASILEETGVFIFQTPYYRGEGANWGQFKPAEHVFLYNPSSIRRLCEAAGLEAVSVIPGYFPDDMFVIGRRKTTPKNLPALLDDADRILFVRTDAIGDAVLASAMLEPIRKKYPQAKIAILCPQPVAELLVACPFIDSIICYDRKTIDTPAERAQIISEIAAFKPDVILNAVRSRDRFSDELTLAFREAKHIAIESDLANYSAADRARSLDQYELLIPSPGAPQPELARHADFLRGLGIEATHLQPVVWTNADDEALAEAFCRQEKLDPQRTLALFPFTQHDTKDYPKFAEALKSFAGWSILIFGGLEKQAQCHQLAQRLPGKVLNLAGRTTLREMAAIMRHCRLLVGGDSCAAHIACAVNVPNVVLLGGGQFGRFLPYSPLTTVAALPLDCYGCDWQCPHERVHCVKDVHPEVLVKAIQSALEKPGGRSKIFLPSADSHPDQVNRPKWRRPDLRCLEATAEIIEVEVKVSAASPAPVKFDPPVMNDCLLIPETMAGPEPLVSVVISTYQSEKFMRACLENLTRQTIFDRCEVIVVDSGSPENERAIVAEFQQKHPNIRYLRTPRETLYGAWNRGLQLARGRYWANLNTDDGLHFSALEMLSSALDHNPDCALAYGDAVWTSKPNDTLPSANIMRTVKHSAYTPVQTLFYCLPICLQFWRTDSIRKLGGFDATLHCSDDYAATLRMMEARMSAVHVPEPLTLFYQNTTGLTQASNRAAVEFVSVMNHHRRRLDISNIFQVAPNHPSAAADAWAVLGYYASSFLIPWDDQPSSHYDFAFECFHKALELDPQNLAAGMNLVVLSAKLERLNPDEAELIRRWPKMREWISMYRMGDGAHLPPVNHAIIGPVFRPAEWRNRPTKEQLAHEPKILRPWICRIDGRHVYLSEDVFQRPAGFRYTTEELQSAAKQLVLLLKELPQFYAHFGGAGDALLLLASFYDKSPDGIVFCHPNSTGAMKAMFEAFPKLSKIYFLPQHTDPFFHIVLRFAIVSQLRNCLGAGSTPLDSYDVEWKAGLDIEKKYGIKKAPRWAAVFRKNQDSRQVAVAPKGSLSGMVGSKRNIIAPEIWPQVLAHIQDRGFEPVILGLPSEVKEYPALPGCTDRRNESFAGQMQIIGQSAGLVGADSWAKTFSALAEIPTIVFEPLKSADLVAWKDPSDWVFIEPWPAIKMVRSIQDFQRAFDSRIARISGAPAATNPAQAVIAWEGSYLDHGSLSHINREITARLSGSLNLVRVSGASTSVITGSDAALTALAKTLHVNSPAQATVTVRHQWPPNWSRPESGSLVVIQPWEYGALPKAWVADAKNVDEFWVPSPTVRAMYLDSGIAPEKVRVVPNGVDVKKFRPGVGALTLPTKKKFKFLFVGGTIFRKGPDILLDAFCRTFTAADDVALVIKDFGGDSFYRGQTAGAAIRDLKSKPNAPEIIHLTEEISGDKMPALYAACDCLVLPYRGEGFGLPVLEAMACGLPVIVTQGGATDSFVTAEVGWKIPSRGLRLGDRVGDIPLVKNGWMLEPSGVHLAGALKYAAAHPEECRQRGAHGRIAAEKRNDWNDIALAVAHRLRELSENAPVKGESTADKNAPGKKPEVPPVAQIGGLLAARTLFGQKKFPAAWEAAINAINERPYHPEAFLLLAEIAASAGDAASASQCAQRAHELAPDWKPAKQFARKTFKGNTRPDWLKLPEKHQPRLSVCLIVKNEEKFLGQCLASIRGLAQQIVLVDTGSTDRTLQIAKEFGAEIHSFAWCEDFAAARNAALAHACGDWILVLDADEELPAEQHANLRADMSKAGMLACRLPLLNRGHEAEGHSFVPRLFRNLPGTFYTGRVHEQVFPTLVPYSRSWGLTVGFGAAELLHHGYTKEMVRDRDKIKRNLNLLRQAVGENPGDPNLLMNYGLELVRSDDLAGGVEKYRMAFNLMSGQAEADIAPELREVLLTQFTCQLYKMQAYDEVVRVLQSPLARIADLSASLNFALGLAYFELKQFDGAAEQMRSCIAQRQKPVFAPINTDIHTLAPEHCLALSLAKLGDAAGAEKAFQGALTGQGSIEDVKLDFAKFLAAQNRQVEAFHKLHELVSANSKNLAAWKTGAEIALGRPEFLEFARDWTSEAVRYATEDFTVSRQRAEVLLLSGDSKNSIELWERLWNSERQPSILAALILCELLESRPRHVTDKTVDEPATSRAFVKWYQKLIAMKAYGVIQRINGQLENLSGTLPTAAKMLEKALAEPQQCAA